MWWYIGSFKIYNKVMCF